MNKYLVLFCILITTNLFAKENSFTTSVSFVGMSMDYREYDKSGELLDTETSNYWDTGGVEVNFAYIIDQGESSHSTISYNFMMLTGNTVYRGSLRDSDEGFGSYIGSTLNTITDKDISYKQSKMISSDYELSYGIGLGYRYWERVLSMRQIEIYTWYSIRPMIGISTLRKDGLSFGAFLEYQYGFDTKMSASEPELNHTFTLGGADILEVTIPVKYNYKEDVAFVFEAVFQKQMIEESDRLYTLSGDAYYYEPDSTAYNSYLKMGIELNF
ncbi:MAG: hypothetical protein U9Q40_05330 [Campylobacterota bacterium]|nr:hypothetical protein [Campylobacterota bacterium]